MTCRDTLGSEGFLSGNLTFASHSSQIFGFLVCMGVILAIGNAIWEHEVGMRFQVYLPWDEAVDSAFFSGFLSFWSYIIILNTVVPISLYVRYVLSVPGVSPGSSGGPLQTSLVYEGETLEKERASPSSCAVDILCYLFIFVCRANLATVSWHCGLCRMKTMSLYWARVCCMLALRTEAC